MIIKDFFTTKVRKGIIHLIVLLIAIRIVAFYFPLRMMDGKYLWQNLGTTLLIIVAFYLHSLVLLPFLLKQKKTKKYLLFSLFGFVLCWIMSLWFQALYSSAITHYEDGSRPKPEILFFQTGWIIQSFITCVIIFIPFSFVSFIYYVLKTDGGHRKELFSFKYTELIVNLIIVGSLLFLVFLNQNYSKAFIVTLLNLAVVILFFYINTFFITPKLIKEKKTEEYLLLIFVSFLIFIGGIEGIYLITKIEIGHFPNLIVAFFLFLITYMLSFVYGFLRIKLINKEQLFNLKLSTKESELQLLKSQVNPHFLFNTLNTLYATALEEQTPKMAESTAKLANLLRYMQEDINKEFIPLENEIKYVQDYIAIQKLRCSVTPKIETKFENIESKVISPGLLIPFVENAFKYGIDPSKPSNLSVSVVCDENTIHFECVNSYDDNFETYYKEQGFGIGIKNAKQRLELVYPKKHHLEVKKENNIFSVKLSIKTN